jgi:hypothetical protein
VDNQTFRAETYYKDYSNLVKYDTQAIAYNSVFNNKGSAYAKGWTFFGEMVKSSKSRILVSYSYIDTKRDYKNFPTVVTLICGQSQFVISN